MGGYSSAKTLMVYENLPADQSSGADYRTEVPTTIEGYDTVILRKNAEVNAIVNEANVGTVVHTYAAELTVNSSLILRELQTRNSSVASKVKVNGDLSITKNDEGVGGILQLTGGYQNIHELDVSGTTTITSALNTSSSLNNYAKLNTQKLVLNGQMLNSGTICANAIEVNHVLSLTSTGKVKANDGEASSIVVNKDGHVQLQGNASSALDLVVQGGKVSVLDNCTASLSDVTMNGGELFIRGDIKTGALTLNEGALTFDFSYGRTPLLDLGGNDLVIGDDVSITLNVKNMEEVADEYVLFTNLGETSGLDSLEIELVSLDDNQTKTVRASYSNGAVVLIPEPTTATLSLLALAGLAARRRRK